MRECTTASWSVRELERQINSMLFERLALSKDKKGVLTLAKKGQVIEEPKDIIKDPYVLEFLGISEDYRLSERELEQMNLYLNYFKKEEMNKEDKEPLGIILAKEKDAVVVEYALGGLSNKLFVSKYQLYLLNKKELEEQVEKILNTEKK